MNIKRALLPIVACCLFTGSISAQSKQARQRPSSRSAMWAAIQLTESQAAQVKAIHTRHAPAMKVAKRVTADSASKIYDREMSDVRGVLTFSQQQTFDSYMNARQLTGRRGRVRATPARIAVPH